VKPSAFGLFALLALSGCENPGQPGQPRLGVGIGIGPNGLALRPRVSTTIDGTTVGGGPGGASVGTNVGGVGVGVGL